MSRPLRLWVIAMVALIMPMPLMIRPVAAQVLSLGHAVGRVGDVVSVDVSLHPAKAHVSALVGDIQFDHTEVSIESCAINPAIGEKSLSTTPIQPNVTRFVVFGLGQSSIPHGVVLTCEFAVLPNAL